ncbi:TonB-dependent receptor [Wenyingzhuangia sp. chi5]|uniref:TonB-dependent receptor n=1 Tax=Wenyingzhuangia gilva TaxID=3057677 RepID=A0ABT8VTS6_9FLAO|nr:TonB-dependent receptor [Wenyingzhuangia sp. chi5]MDO3695371.1 TonB-dependent receptor [Wenyingzhuangia sp. chi5]
MRKTILKNIHSGLKYNYCIPLLMFFLVSQVALAQVEVKGTVKDSKGTTLPGVNVLQKGTNIGTMTDFDGNYTLTVADNAVLSFTYLGFESQDIKVGSKTTVNVVLKASSESLDEVVIIGYGSQKRSDVNSAISSIKAEDIQNSKATSFDQMMQGKAAGVTINSNSGQPGGNVSVKIRGISSLTGTNEPLYVIDGIPMSGDARNSSTSGRSATGESNFSNAGNISISPLSMINPSDIESIDILKDASATAIYGSRGANGVIIVTTKSGKQGTGKISYDKSYAISNLPKMLDAMNLREYAAHQNALADVYDPTQKRPEFAIPSLLGEGTNWQKEIFRTGIMESDQISFSGGKDGINYYLSGGRVQQDGIVIESRFKRYNLRANIDARLNKSIKVGLIATGSMTDEKLTLNGQFDGVVARSLLSTPDVPVREFNGDFAGPKLGTVTFVNPVAETLLGSNKLERKNYSANFYTDIKLFKGLEYRFEVGGYKSDNLGRQFVPMYSLGNAVKNFANLYYRPQTSYSWNLKNMLTYRNTIGKHNFTLLAVQEANKAHWEGHSLTANGYKDNSDKSLSGSDLSKAELSGVFIGTQALSSYLGRAVYDYDNKYGFTAAIRTDGSSKFFKGNKWSVFRSIGASWKVSNESFMESFKPFVDNVKIRFGYGETGNNQIGNNLYDSNLALTNSSMGTSFLPANESNQLLTWETQKQTNLGLDFALFNSKLSTSIDVYRKVSESFLYKLPLPNFLSGGASYEGGVDPPFFNLGSMVNKGVEISVNYNTNITDDFSWNSSLNFTKYVNEVTDMLGLNIDRSVNNLAYQSLSVSRTQEGVSIGSFYGYEALGIYRTDEDLIKYGHTNDTGTKEVLKDGTNSLLPDFQKGDVIYKDQNGDGIINTKDKTNIGNPNPDFTYGFTNSFKYKNLELSVFIQGSYGNKLMNITRLSGTLNSYLGTNYLNEASDFYSATNLDAKLPRPSDYSHINNGISSRLVEDGSYLRIQNVTLGYSIPKELLSSIHLSKLRVYVTGQNLFTFTNYSGYDPEVGSFNQDALLTGVDSGRYPTPRVLSLGLNVEF